ncbi:MAG: hypothetical protein JKY67_07680 [Pseudomonadales bacterium]|nr:hypothetical protein [Pseudomonadales bacterium]
MKYKALTAGLLSFLLSGTALAEVMVVVHAKSEITAIDKKTLKKLFLGKTKKISGVVVTPINLPNDHALKIEFDQKALKKDPSRMTAYWSNMIFTGKGAPLDQVEDEAEMLRVLAKNRTSIGYMSAGAISEKVKVLVTIP